MADMKKALQNVCKTFRDTQGESSAFPKAMMTQQQIRLNTATINCGRAEYGEERSAQVMKFAPFLEWCETFGIKTVKVEIAREASYMKPQYQIRVTY